MNNIYILSTNKPSRLYEFGGDLILTNEPAAAFRNQNIYITNSEEIKEGDWNLPPSNIPVKYQGQKFKGDEPLKCWKKIILTTDLELQQDGVQPIDEEFLEWICNNPSCKFVELKDSKKVKEHIWDGSKDGGIIWEKEIIIPKEEPKMPCQYCGENCFEGEGCDDIF